MSEWQMSSHCSGGSCVEVKFIRSSACADGSCVEVADAGEKVLIRDGKLGEASPVVAVSSADWPGFLESIPDLDKELNG